MYLDKVIAIVNRLISNSSSYKLNFNQIEHYMDRSIDYINQNLLTKFLVPSEYYENKKFYFSIIRYLRENSDDYLYVGSFDTIDKIPDVVSTDKEMVFYINNENKFYSFDSEHNYVWTPEPKKIDMDTDEEVEITLTMYKDIHSLGTIYFDYDNVPDDIIRNILVYLTATYYLEEEDELEGQYKVYKDNAENYITYLKKKYTSCLKCWW